MTKKELLADLEARSFIDGIVGLPSVKETQADGTKSYSVTYREVNGKVVKNMTVFFYVIDEGTPEERAFYKNKEPGSQVAVKLTDKVQISVDYISKFGKIIESGDSFVIMQGFLDTATGVTRKLYRVTEDGEGKLVVKELE